MLSESLRLELVIHMNGKMLHNTQLFKNFDIQFLSELTFVLKKETLNDDFKLFDVKFLIQKILNFRRVTKEQLCILLLEAV